MIKISKIAYITLETPELDRQLEYYQYVIGLHPVAREKDSIYLATATGETSVILQRGSSQRCSKLGFQVAPETDFAAAIKDLAAEGISAELRKDRQPGVGRLLTFQDINGTTIELFTEPHFTPVKHISGIAPLKLAHVAFLVDDPVATSAFYERVLGFRVSDWVDRFFVFMRCGPDHHTLNFLKAEGRRMHHFAFELRDVAHLTQSCDVLGKEKLEIIWGPVRHGPGHNVATYHFNPDGLMVELFTELDRMSHEELGFFDPKPWHHDFPQRPKTWPGRQRRDVWGPEIPSNFLLQGF